MSSARVQNWRLAETPSTDVIGDLWRFIKLSGSARPPSQDSGPRQTGEAFPTVLIAAGNAGLRQSLSNHLRQDPCNILHADCAERLWHTIVNHSRPIHVLLLEAGLEGPDFEEMAKQFRPGMKILFVANSPTQSQPRALTADAAAAQARELLPPRK
jgi:hypothetical protein